MPKQRTIETPTPEQATVLDLMAPKADATPAELEAEAEALVELDHLAQAEHIPRVAVDPTPEEVAYEFGYRQAMLDAVHRCRLERSGHVLGDTIIQNCIGSIQGMNARAAVVEWSNLPDGGEGPATKATDYGAMF